jgi:hypothetical protein
MLSPVSNPVRRRSRLCYGENSACAEICIILLRRKMLLGLAAAEALGLGIQIFDDLNDLDGPQTD